MTPLRIAHHLLFLAFVFVGLPAALIAIFT